MILAFLTYELYFVKSKKVYESEGLDFRSNKVRSSCRCQEWVPSRNELS